jgi:hypothetical protein
MATSFYGGSFFGGEFFNMGGAAPEVRRRWAKIGNKVYHATDEDIRYLLSLEPEVEVVPITKRQAKRIRAAQAKVKVSPQVRPEWDDEDDIEILLWH